MRNTGRRFVVRFCLAVLTLALMGLPPTRAVPAVVPGAGNTGAQHGGDLYSLAGQAGLPKYLKCNQECRANADGVRGGEARTFDTDYFKKDFTLDVVFQFQGDDDRGTGFVGIGEHGTDTAASITVSLQGPAAGGVATLDQRHRPAPRPGKKKGDGAQNGEIGKLSKTGPDLLRLEKKGNSLTFYLCADYKGIFRADSKTELPDISKTASGLNRLNSALYFGGDVTFKSVRLEVDGSLVDPGPPGSSLAKDIDVAGNEHFVKLTPGNPTPDWLVIPANAAIGTDGLGLDGITVRTKDSDFLTKDFTFDLVYHFKPGEKAIMVVGVGENGHDSGNWILNSIASRVHGPGYDGQATVTFHNFWNDPTFGKVGPDHPGPNLFRIQKRGNTLTLAICADFKGKFDPDFSTTIPSLSSQAPYLNGKNTSIFFYGGATVEQVRLVVGGEPAAKYEVAGGHGAAPAAITATTSLNAAVGKLVPLSGQAGLPGWLHGSINTVADADGLRGGKLLSANHDFAQKNFTLDLLFEFNENDKEFRAGIGEDKGQWGESEASVCVRVDGPKRDGDSRIGIDGRKAQIPLGKIGKDPGPHLLRIQKLANTLTVAICADYKPQGPFNPTVIKTVPDLASAASFLNSTNGQLFIAGDATWMAASLTVDGKPVDGAASATVSATGTPSSTLRTVGPAAGPAASGAGPAPGATAAAPAAQSGRLFSLGGQAGLPSYLRVSPQVYADAVGLRGGKWRSAATDLIEHDFVFDLLFKLDDPDKGFRAGLGEDKGDWGEAENSVCVKVEAPNHDADARIAINGRGAEIPLGKLGKSAGPHLLRIDKHGRALTFSLYADNKGGAPTFVKTVPDLPGAAPFLKNTNSGLFVAGDAVATAVGFSLDGRPAIDTTPASQGFKDIVGPENLIKLAGVKAVPDFFVPTRDVTFGKDGLGLGGKMLRSKLAGFVSKNFTLDLVFHFNHDENATITMGIGENAHDNDKIVNSVYCRARGPGAGSSLSHGMDQPGADKLPQWGDLGNDHLGPNLLRMQKRGDTLTFALCAEFKGRFTPAVTRTIPSLRQVAPYLTAKNSYLFVEADGGIIEEARLVTEGEASWSGDVALAVPPKVVEGQPVRKLIAAASAGRAFAADPSTAPKGLTISPAGELAWVPGHDQIGHHEFKVSITDKGAVTSQSVEIDVVSKEDAAVVKGDLAKLDTLYKLPLETEHHPIFPGFGGASLLLLEGDQLRRLDADGLTVRQDLRLPHRYGWIGERKNYFVALSDETKSLDVLDKTNLTVIRGIQMDYTRRSDLCLNPVKPLSYVTVDKAGHDGAVHQILVVDELTGDVREPDDFVGTFLKVTPNGRVLYAAYRDIYRKGDRLLINPGWVGTVPEYGNIDILIVYDISGQTPREVAVKDEAGGNGQGLAMTPDGRKICYLSYVGYPLYSNNIAIWDPTDMTKRPIACATKENKADCKHLSFHPALPIAASPAPGGAACFDYNTGQFEPNRLDLRSPLPDNVKVLDAVFSPDGQNLILDCEASSERFLQKVKLNLSAREQAALKSPRPAREPAPSAPSGEPGQGRQKV